MTAQKELARLRKENEILRQERDLLKKQRPSSRKRQVDDVRDPRCAEGRDSDQAELRAVWREFSGYYA